MLTNWALRRSRGLKLLSGQLIRCTFSTQNHEVVESYWQVEQKVAELTSLLQKSKHSIIFTGAGISTSLGIPDYRSGPETILNTGPGLWNRKDLHSKPQPHEIPIDKLVDRAQPSLTHMFIATLVKKGIIKHLVSQNTDGLHLRSGVPMDRVSELHGNRNVQTCVSCQRKYFRDFRTIRRSPQKREPGEKRDHFTGRQCENCGGDLHDSIIYFGQKLPVDQLKTAYMHAHKADLCICMGSSLTVKPSSNVPLLTLQKNPPGKVCTINLQKTPFDEVAEVKVNYFCDETCELLAQALGVSFEPMVFQHHLQITIQSQGEELLLRMAGKDKEGNNLSFIRQASVSLGQRIDFFEVKGHCCEIRLNKDSLDDGQVTLDHYGQKKSLKLQLSDLRIMPGESRSLTYQAKGDSNWQVSL